MPLYEYECQRCHKRTEKIQHFSSEPLKECPHCGGPLERLLSAPAIQFKGTGWYVTDYAHSNTSQAASHEPKPAAAPATSTNGDGAKAAPASAPATTKSES